MIYDQLTKGLYRISPTAQEGYFEISPDQISAGFLVNPVEQTVGLLKTGETSGQRTELSGDTNTLKFYDENNNLVLSLGTTLFSSFIEINRDSTGGSGMYINVSGTGRGLSLISSADAGGLYISNTGTNVSANALEIVHTGNGSAIEVSNNYDSDVQTNARGVRITNSNLSRGNMFELVNNVTTSSHFKKEMVLDGVTVWKSDGTTPSGNLSGTAGDICINGSSSAVFYCTGTTNWTGPVTDSFLVTVTAGELLTAGEVVRLQKGGGYASSAGTLYAMRAAANDSTYGNKIFGIAYDSMTYLGTGRVRIGGYFSGLSGLSDDGSPQYLDNYSASSGLTISQTAQNSLQTLNTNVFQLWVPTSSRLDKAIFYIKQNAGGAGSVDVNVKRANSTITTANQTISPGGPAEYTFDFTDVQVYKGEVLKFDFVGGSGNEQVAYQSTGDAYAGQYQGSSAGNDAGGGSIPASGADVYMKVYEYTNFGKLAAAAGTRKIRMGFPLSATELAMAIQYGDSIL